MLLAIFSQLGEHVTAKEYDEKEIAIAQKIGKKTCTESICYKLLGGISNVNREYATDVKSRLRNIKKKHLKSPKKSVIGNKKQYATQEYWRYVVGGQ